MIRGYVDTLPPSVNRMYRSGAFGRQVPTKELSVFKAQTKMKLAKQWLTVEPPKQDAPYGLTLIFFMPDMQNKGWPKSAKSRFKKRDASNLIKAVEDAISEAIGIDDKNFVGVTVFKKIGVEPGIDIRIEELPDDSIVCPVGDDGEPAQWDEETKRLREICLKT